MQKQIGKRKFGQKALSLLLAFVMVFSLGNFAMVPSAKAYTGISNPTVSAALDAMVGLTGNESTLNLSANDDIIGKVDINELKAQFPNLTFVNLNNTNTSQIYNTVGVVVSSQGTFVDFVSGSGTGGKRMEFDGTALTYTLALGGDITVADIFNHLNIVGTAKGPSDLIDRISVDVIDSGMTIYTGSSGSGNLSLTDVIVPDGIITTPIQPGTTLELDVSITFKNLQGTIAGGSPGLVTMDLLVNDYTYRPTSASVLNAFGPNAWPDYYIYTSDEIVVYLEKLDENGVRMPITAAEFANPNLNKTLYDVSTNTDLTSAATIQLTSDGLLEIRHPAMGVASNPGDFVGIDIIDNNHNNQIYFQLGIAINDYPSIPPSDDLYMAEYNTGVGTIAGSGPSSSGTAVVQQPLYLYAASDISSMDSLTKLGEYSATTAYVLSYGTSFGGSTPLLYEHSGMVSLTATDNTSPLVSISGITFEPVRVPNPLLAAAICSESPSLPTGRLRPAPWRMSS